MQNPWAELSGDSPCVLQTDRDAVDRVNDRFSLQPDFQIQSQLLPEPFIGAPTAAVYLLGLNPGYCPADDEWHNNTRFRHAIQNCLNHKPANLPFYFLDPQFVEAPGAIWWKQRTRWLKNEVELTTLAQNLFCVELFPYHSRRYKPIPKVISQNQLVPSSQYSVHLVRQAIAAQKTIVAMRSFKKWCQLLPELSTYPKLVRLNSPQNVSLSPKNLPGFPLVIRDLQQR